MTGDDLRCQKCNSRAVDVAKEFNLNQYFGETGREMFLSFLCEKSHMNCLKGKIDDNKTIIWSYLKAK